MKSIEEQIKFIDKTLLPIYGIKNIIDYDSIVSLNKLNDDKKIIKKLNNVIDEFREIFPIKNFSLHKTKYKIEDSKHSFNFLKLVLSSAKVPYDIIKKKDDTVVRLISENKILYKYIMNSHGTSDNRHFEGELSLNSNVYTSK